MCSKKENRQDNFEINLLENRWEYMIQNLYDVANKFDATLIDEMDALVDGEIDTEIFEVDEFKQLIQDSYNFFKPYLASESLPCEYIILIAKIYSFCDNPMQVGKTATACKIVARAFIEMLCNKFFTDDEENIKVVSDYTDEASNIITSKVEYIYNVAEGDLSEVVGMIAELEDHGIVL